jgi:hypothetical protein
MPDDLTWPSGGHYFHHVAGTEWDDGELIEEDINKDGSSGDPAASEAAGPPISSSLWHPIKAFRTYSFDTSFLSIADNL